LPNPQHNSLFSQNKKIIPGETADPSFLQPKQIPLNPFMFTVSKLKTMQVRSYSIFLDLDFQNLQFKGRVLIELESERDVILGIGRVEEVKRFFEENRIPEAEKGIEAGIEKLKIYDRLVKKA